MENSTLYWVHTVLETLPLEVVTSTRHEDKLEHYHNWMREQGVIIKGKDYIYRADDPCLDFVDENSMLLFILKWGN